MFGRKEENQLPPVYLVLEQPEEDWSDYVTVAKTGAHTAYATDVWEGKIVDLQAREAYMKNFKAEDPVQQAYQFMADRGHETMGVALKDVKWDIKRTSNRKSLAKCMTERLAFHKHQAKYYAKMSCSNILQWFRVKKMIMCSI